MAGLLTRPDFWNLPIYPAESGSKTVVISKSHVALVGPGFTAAGTVAGSNDIPFSFPRLSRDMETNNELKVQINF